MKKITVIILAAIMVLGTTAVFAEGFNDISGHWAETEILEAQANGIINGDGTGAFRPNDKVTRAEFVKMLSAMLVQKFGVDDVPDDFKTEENWYSKYYNFATGYYLEQDTVNTIGEVHPGVFENGNELSVINRWEMAYMAGSLLYTQLGMLYETEPTFTDVEELNALPNADAMKIACENGIIKGDGNGAFNAMGTGSRAEAVVIVSRINNLIDEFILAQETAYNEMMAEIQAEYDSKLITYDEKDIPSKEVEIKFTMDSGDTFTVELYPQYAPQTVANFVKLVNEGFYNGLTFHRVVDGFMAQGGDPNGDGTGMADNYIFGEFASNGFTQNTLSHTKGVISMARSQIPNSASSGFFICYDDATFLDGEYAAFGKVVSGMDTVEAFLKVERTVNAMGEEATPVRPIVIKSAKVIK